MQLHIKVLWFYFLQDCNDILHHCINIYICSGISFPIVKKQIIYKVYTWYYLPIWFLIFIYFIYFVEYFISDLFQLENIVNSCWTLLDKRWVSDMREKTNSHSFHDIVSIMI